MNFFKNKQIDVNEDLRILYFTPIFTYKHSSTYLSNEINAISKNFPHIKFIIYVVTLPKKNKIIKINNRILQVNRKSYKNFLFLTDMIKIFTKFKPHVVHSHYVVPSIFVNLFAKIFRVPTILHGRGQDINYYPYFSLKSKILLLIAGRLNTIILAVCESMKNDCLRFKISKKKVKVLYNGIDFKKFNPKEKVFFSYQRPLELLHIGHFSLRKRQNLIIEACKKLKDINVKFHLTLIGEGGEKQNLVELINKYELKNYVDLLGWVDNKEIPSYIEKADLLVFPSITEGLPNVVLEAMSMKLAVILTSVDGNLEVAQNTGSILVEKDNYQQIFEAILHYYNNPREIEIGGEINRNFIVKTFSWEKHAKELYQVYNFLANKRNITNEKA